MAAEVDELRVLWTGHLPRIAVLEPLVRLFHLVAADDLLAEDAVVVAKAISHSGEVESRHRVDVAGRKAAKAAVAEAGIGLVVAQAVPVEPVFLEGLAA